jgi:hypothetical protein
VSLASCRLCTPHTRVRGCLVRASLVCACCVSPRPSTPQFAGQMTVGTLVQAPFHLNINGKALRVEPPAAAAEIAPEASLQRLRLMVSELHSQLGLQELERHQEERVLLLKNKLLPMEEARQRMEVRLVLLAALVMHAPQTRMHDRWRRSSGPDVLSGFSLAPWGCSLASWLA